MIKEHELLFEIVEDLTRKERRTYINKPTDRIFWKDDSGRNILVCENEHKTVIRSSEEDVRYYSDILKEESEKYYQALKSSSTSELKRTKELRERELIHLYKIAGEQIKHLYEELPLPDVHRINALWDLTQSYIVSSVVTYSDNGLPGFLHTFFCSLLPQEIEALAQVSQLEGRMEFNEFRQICIAPTTEPKRKRIQYDLLAEYPGAEELMKLYPEYLDDSLMPQKGTKKVDLSIIADTIGTVLGVPAKKKWTIFESFWGMNDLRNSNKQVHDGKKVRELAERAMRRKCSGVQDTITDNELLNQFTSLYSRRN